MNRTRIHTLLRPALALGATAAMLSGAHALAATAPSYNAQARYQQERAACLAGQTTQGETTCLKEAGAALAQARRSGLDDGTERYGRNALERCAPLPDEDRIACVARMRGLGTTSGSVEGGGILRELVIREIVVPDDAVEPDAQRAR